MVREKRGGSRRWRWEGEWTIREGDESSGRERKERKGKKRRRSVRERERCV